MPGTRHTSKLREHERAAFVPGMGAEEYRAFCADVAKRGIVDPLEITNGGIVLDGRQRLRAARELGIHSAPVRVVTPEDEVAHMLLAALQRRHLSQSQKAALAIELDHYQRARAEADERRRANLRRGLEVATLPPRCERTREFAARIAGVSARTVQDALTVKGADPELFEKVKAGELPAHAARRQIERARRYAEIPAAPPLPRELFELIYADPAWKLGNPDSDYAPEAHYQTMALAEIKAATGSGRRRRPPFPLGSQLDPAAGARGDGGLGL